MEKRSARGEKGATPGSAMALAFAVSDNSRVQPDQRILSGLRRSAGVLKEVCSVRNRTCVPRVFRKAACLSALLLAVGLAAGASLAGQASLVRWSEYTDETFRNARVENKPLFLLISATWCYNCQIYERVLGDEEVAAYINENFIPIFVDYDRRRDLARAYPSVGIPVTSILGPSGVVLVSAPGVFAKEELLSHLEQTLRRFREGPQSGPPPPRQEARQRIVVPTASRLQDYSSEFAGWMRRSLDPAYGGFGLDAKEPRADLLLRLLERYLRGEKEWEAPLRVTLNHLVGQERDPGIEGRPAFQELLELRRNQHQRLREVEDLQVGHPLSGLYDPVEGGFFRYATRRNWTVPHFEKMLFENAEIVELLFAAHRILGDAAYRTAAERTVGYLLRTLYSQQEGRFFGSQAADEVYYHLSEAERRRAEPPPVDGTTYAVASARALIALLGVPRGPMKDPATDAARRGLAFVVARLVTDEGVLSFVDPVGGRTGPNGNLRDNVWVVRALLTAYEATREPGYRAAAVGLLGYCEKRLYDRESGGFLRRNSTSRDSYREGDLLRTEKDVEENGLMAEVLLHARALTGNEAYLRMAETTVGYLLEEAADGRIEAVWAPLDRAVERLVAAQGTPPPSPESPGATRPAVPTWRHEEDRGRNGLGGAGFGALLLLAVAAGMLSFLSPCTLPVLPAYFAFAFGSDRSGILIRTLAFFVGLALGFSALGASATALGAALGAHRAVLERVGGGLIALFGAASLLGKGFAGFPVRFSPAAGPAGSLLFGLAFSVGWGTCVGPILAALLVMAATRGQALSGATLLFVYAIGLGLPLTVASLVLGRLDRGALPWRILRGRGWEARLGRHRLAVHTTGLASGALFLGLGLLMATGHLTYLNRVLPLPLQAWFAGLEESLTRLLSVGR